ncbi:MAG: iron export transporter permease subunit FetB [Frankiales bacterium]|jgi:putative ABC transport system permease protein|nr:iron export transporter permease subunit FetB [Frankiales bacterium]
MTPEVPSWLGVATSVLLVGLCLAVVVRERLGLTRDVVVAAVRAVVQLAAVGAVLGVLFERAGAPGAVLWVSGMVLVAGRVAGGRAKGVPRAQRTATLAVAAGVVATMGLLVVARVVDVEPRVVVPIGGMVVSAALRGTTVVLRRLHEEATSTRREIEARLALGLSPTQAFAPSRRSALRTALVTDIDAVKTVGLISLPGAMTGLLLAGVPPLTAIRFQVVVMYMLLGAVSVSAVVAARLAERELFTPAEGLRRLEPA